MNFLGIHFSKRPPRALGYAGVSGEELLELELRRDFGALEVEEVELELEDEGARMGGVCTPAATFVTRDDIVTCARPTHDGIESLNKDVHKNLVYEDPQKLRDTAKIFQDLADSSPTEEMKKSQQAIADEMTSKADELESRQKDLSPTVAAQQIAFGEAWGSFYDKWNTFYESNVASSGDDPGDLTLNQIGTYDEQYRSFVGQYKSITGKTPTYVPPSPSGGGTLDTIITILKWGIVIVVIGGAIVFVRGFGAK